MAPHVARDAVWNHITRFLEPYWELNSKSHVLELGTGYGAWIKSIKANQREALDSYPELHQLFQKNGIKDVAAHVGDCTDLGRWKSETLDLVLASNLLEHLDHDELNSCIKEIFRILKPGGQLCLVQPNFALCPKEYFDDYTHKTVFTHVSLSDFVSAHGFQVIKLWKRFLPLTLKSAGSRLTFLVPFYLRSPIKPLAGQMCLLAQRRDH